MFVLTIDQRRSRDGTDRVDHLIERLRALGGDELAAAPERTAGDEVQTATEEPECALALLLAVLRDGGWHVGLGIGSVRRPLLSSIRSGAGDAFVAARRAVDAAKSSPLGLAVRAVPDHDAPTAEHVEALIDLLLAVRDRRSDAGWEVSDLLDGGSTQAQVAERLAVTPQAVSLRARAAGWRWDDAARPALSTLLGMLDRQLDPPEER
ncbi:DNA-binding protein [Arenivirga flava]|uniref:Transcriptional regulator n=1 Tax=Arenivirga flava TaxID=1930060 RepID=A0AA37UAE0_9MICO|nr:DNA-binding protein [Arenivirga flava]GMA27123.1 transcriptional regulator [Arenivirga flava]